MSESNNGNENGDPNAGGFESQPEKRRRLMIRLLKTKLLPLALGLGALSGGLWFLAGRPNQPLESKPLIRVLSYSSFISAWGPGPEIAARFRAEFGKDIVFQDAGDAGLILNRLSLNSADAVVGLDQFTLIQARSERKWRALPARDDESNEIRFRETEFIPFDWGPMTFIYRKGETAPPNSLDDLLDPRFKSAIALQDPRTSTPGLQFLFWVLTEKGEEEGFKYLGLLKRQVHSVSPSWSMAYGLFTEKRAKLAFSYLTSPVYHWTQDSDESYQPAVFPKGHPAQVEYAAVPDNCVDCEGGEQFVRFLLKPEIQAIIMSKNYMFPVVPSVIDGTPFAQLPKVEVLSSPDREKWMSRREELFERWRKLGL